MNKQEKVKERLLKYFKENEDVFNEIILNLDCSTDILGNDKFYDMPELQEFFNEDPCGSVIDLLLKAHCGKDLDSQDRPFNPTRDYFRLNAYGNLESTNYPDYSSHLNDEFLEQVIEYKGELCSVQDNSELREILF